MMNTAWKIILITVFSIFILVAGALYYMEYKNMPFTIGSDNKGYVIKDIYAADGQHKTKIAIITGMHPREKIAIDPMKNAAMNYALTHDLEITNYDIHVVDNPDNYTLGRFNGEELANQYIVPDIKKSNYNLVIIFHAHQQGYGSGYYISTPAMDNKSVEMAQNVQEVSPSFGYYRSYESGYKSSSASKVSDPIAKDVPTFVYEIPEQSDTEDATNMTCRLLDMFLNGTANRVS